MYIVHSPRTWRNMEVTTTLAKLPRWHTDTNTHTTLQLTQFSSLITTIWRLSSKLLAQNKSLHIMNRFLEADVVSSSCSSILVPLLLYLDLEVGLIMSGSVEWSGTTSSWCAGSLATWRSDISLSCSDQSSPTSTILTLSTRQSSSPASGLTPVKSLRCSTFKKLKSRWSMFASTKNTTLWKSVP